MKQLGWILAASLALVLVTGVPAYGAPSEGPSILSPGDYGVYTMGCGHDGAWFYPPFFGFPDAENASDQINIIGQTCYIQLRWDVLDVTGETATVELQMSGWRSLGEGLVVRNSTVSLDSSDPVYDGILDVLHAKRTLLVDLSTMDVTEGNTYIGRWTFHVTTGDIINGRSEIIRNWLEGTSLSVPLQVTKSVDPGDVDNLKAVYGIDTFVDIFGGGGTMPESFGKYVRNGWGARQKTLPPAGRYHDPTTSLLLVSYSYHYDDLLFNLYGLLMLTGFGEFPGGTKGHFSFMHLVETNIIELPVPDTGGAGGGTGDDTGGDTGQGSDDEGPGPGDGTEVGGTPDDPGLFPWSAVFLFGAVAVLTVVVAYLRLRPGGRVRP